MFVPFFLHSSLKKLLKKKRIVKNSSGIILVFFSITAWPIGSLTSLLQTLGYEKSLFHLDDGFILTLMI